MVRNESPAPKAEKAAKAETKLTLGSKASVIALPPAEVRLASRPPTAAAGLKTGHLRGSSLLVGLITLAAAGGACLVAWWQAPSHPWINEPVERALVGSILVVFVLGWLATGAGEAVHVNVKPILGGFLVMLLACFVAWQHALPFMNEQHEVMLALGVLAVFYGGYVAAGAVAQLSTEVLAGILTLLLASLAAGQSQHPWIDEREEVALVVIGLGVFTVGSFVEAQSRIPLMLGIVMTMVLVGFVAWQSKHPLHPWVDEFDEIAVVLSVPAIFSVGYYAATVLKQLPNTTPAAAGANLSIQRSLGGLLTVGLVCFACWHRQHPWIDEVEEIALVLSIVSILTFLMVAVALIRVGLYIWMGISSRVALIMVAVALITGAYVMPQ